MIGPRSQAQIVLCSLLTVLFAVSFLACCSSPKHDKRNVLFISVDDLRPSLGCYGAVGAKTPVLDKLAASGTRFDRAYCQMASCGPSRAAVITGCRPDTNGVHDLTTSYRDALPDLVVLPELFRKNGWFTAALGKVQHGPPTGPLAGKLDDPRAWSVPCWRPERWQTYYGSENAQRVQRELEEEAQRAADERGDGIVWAVPRGLAWDAPDVGDSELGDGMIADRAIEMLEEHADEPFFLALGFLKPHMPYVAPKRYWDLHSKETLPALIEQPNPHGAPSIALQGSREVRVHANIPMEGPLSAETRGELVHAYYACTSYIDAQIGRVLAKLDELGLADNTIVVVWGDHGWHLGEQGVFGKHTNYESAVRSPLLIRVPGQTQVAASSSFVELIDLYPTLAELCGLTVPSVVEGTSFAAQLTSTEVAGKDAVFHQYARSLPGRKQRTIGHAIRTETHRYVEWTHPLMPLERELYDLTEDPEELTNIVESSPAVASELQARLRAQ